MVYCRFQGKCTDHIGDFYNIAINVVDDRVYELSPEKYLSDTIDSKNQSWCQVLIHSTPGNDFETTFRLGDIFMQQFYLMLDYDNSRFALNGKWVPTAQMNTSRYWPDPTPTPPSPAPPGPSPTPDQDQGSSDQGGASSTVIIIAIVAGVVVLLVAAGIVIYKRRNKRLQDELSRQELL